MNVTHHAWGLAIAAALTGCAPLTTLPEAPTAPPAPDVRPAEPPGSVSSPIEAPAEPVTLPVPAQPTAAPVEPAPTAEPVPTEIEDPYTWWVDPEELDAKPTPAPRKPKKRKGGDA